MTLFRFIFLGIALFGSGSARAASHCPVDVGVSGAGETVEQVSQGLSIQDRYQAFKEDYLGTGMCDPSFNYSGDRRLALLVSAVKSDLSSVCQWGKAMDPGFLTKLKQELRVSPAEAAETDRELAKCSTAALGGDPNAYYLAYARFKVSAYKMIVRKFKSGPESLPPLGAPFIYKKMESIKMTRLKGDGTPDCDGEFVSFDAFSKALTGYEALKRSGKVPRNSRYLTIVDYTKPSNSRRMMVLDLTTHRVVNQTWVAHGDGVPELTQAEYTRRSQMRPTPTPFPSEKGGNDRFGSSPKTGNEHKSNLSSLGFIRAETEYNGTWGRSLRLHGLEPGVNDQMLSRGVVLHGWGVNQMSWTSRDDFRSGVAEVSSIGSLEGKTMAELNAMDGRMSNVSFSTVNNATKGCLGVSEEPVKIRQPDGSFQGEMNQRDFLIQILGGKANGTPSAPSFIFNYGGQEQKSIYYD